MNDTASGQPNWTREQTSILIFLYEKCPCLYDPSHPAYGIKFKQKEKYQYILNEMKDIRLNVTVKDIKAKIKTLYNQMSREKSNMLSKENGAEFGEAQRPKLWCYDQLKFILKPRGDCQRITNKNINEDFADETLDRNSKEATEVHDFADETLDINSKESPEGRDLADETFDRSTEQTLGRIFGKSTEQPLKVQDLPGESFGRTIEQKQRVQNSTCETFDKSTEEPPRKIFLRVKQPQELQGNVMTPVTFVHRPAEEENALNMQQGKEAEFCRFLCSELKNIKNEDNFDNLKWEILELVRSAIIRDKAESARYFPKLTVKTLPRND